MEDRAATSTGKSSVDRVSDAWPTTVVVSANTFWNIENFRGGLVNAIASQGHRVIVAAPEPNEAWTGSRGVEAAAVSVDRSGLNPLRDVRLLTQYLDLFKRSNAKIYFGFTVKPNIYGSLAARLSGRVAVPNVSGLGTAFISEGPLSWLVSRLYRMAFRNCPIIFFQNADDRQLFISRKIVKSSQTRLLPGSGVDLRRFQPTPQHNSQTIFLLIGRLIGDKGVREFARAAERLRTQHPDWRFQLLGNADEGNRTSIRRAELDRWIEAGSIEYLGPTNDVRPFITEATAVVLPSYREGMPRTLLEAAAMARPLVATDVPGNRQLVQDGVNGLLCKPRDWVSLAEAMRSIGQKSTEDRDAMGIAARHIVEKDYGEDHVISAYLDAMSQLHSSGRV